MSQLSVAQSIDIDRPAEVVWRQFGDVAHHASTGVHAGVIFEVDHDDGTECHYRQSTKVGPLRLRQGFELRREAGQPLVNRIVSGQFAGGSITFTILSTGDESTRVDARLDAPIRGPQRLLTPLLRRSVRTSLIAALAEDKADLESGHYS